MDSTPKSHPKVSVSKLPVPSAKDVQVIGIQTALDVHASELTRKLKIKLASVISMVVGVTSELQIFDDLRQSIKEQMSKK